MKTNNKYIKLVFFGLGIIIIILPFTLVSSNFVKSILIFLPGIDKVLHFAGAAISTFIVYLIFRIIFPSFSQKQNTLLSSIFIVIISFMLEVHQLSIPDRSFEIMDIIANISGVVFAIVVINFKVIPKLYLAGLILFSIAITSILTIVTYADLKDYYKGIRLEQQGEYKFARQYYNLAYKAGQTNAGLLNSMAWLDVEFLDADIDSAYVYSQTALKSDSANPDYLDTFGWVLYHKGEYNRALKYLLAAFKKSPDMFCVHYHLGKTYAALDNFENAIFHFKKQIEKNPNDRDGLNAADDLRKIIQKSKTES